MSKKPPFCKYLLVAPGVGEIGKQRTLVQAMGAAARWLDANPAADHVVLVDRKALCGSADMFAVDRQGQRAAIRRKPTAGEILRRAEAAKREPRPGTPARTHRARATPAKGETAISGYNKPPLNCPHCGRPFQFDHRLISHLRNAHGLNEDDVGTAFKAAIRAGEREGPNTDADQ